LRPGTHGINDDRGRHRALGRVDSVLDLDKWRHSALQLAVTEIFHRLAPDAKSIVDLYSGNELLVGGCAAGSGGDRLSARAKVVALDRDARAARKWYQRRRHTSHNGIADWTSC